MAEPVGLVSKHFFHYFPCPAAHYTGICWTLYNGLCNVMCVHAMYMKKTVIKPIRIYSLIYNNIRPPLYAPPDLQI